MFEKLKRLKIKFINFKEKTKNKNEKINVQKVKEVGLIVAAAVLIGIGYTNFSSNSNISKSLDSNTLATSTTNSIGDVQLVSSSAAIVENTDENIAQEKTVNGSIVSNDNNESKPQNVLADDTVQTSSSNNSYFSELKMDRDSMYSKSLETYQKIIDSEGISSEQKAIAIQEIEKINNLQNSIKIAEELIKLKDFEDVVIYSSNDKVSVIVRIAVLSDSQVAQIQNIVSKELGVEVANITISNK